MAISYAASSAGPAKGARKHSARVPKKNQQLLPGPCAHTAVLARAGCKRYEYIRAHAIHWLCALQDTRRGAVQHSSLYVLYNFI